MLNKSGSTQFLVGYLKSLLTKRLVVLFSLTSPIVIYAPSGRISLAVATEGLVCVVDTLKKQTPSLLSDIFLIDSNADWVTNAYLLDIF